MQLIETQDFATGLAKEAAIQPEKVAGFIAGLSKAVKDALAQGKAITVPGLGIFGAGDQAPAEPLAPAQTSRAISESAGIDQPTCDKLCALFTASLLKLVLDQKRVAVKDLGYFQVHQRKAKVVKDSAKGHRIIKPAANYIHVQPAEPLAAALAGKALSYQPEDQLRKKVEETRSSSILLAVPEKDFFIATLEYYFGRAGWRINTTTSVSDALKRIEGDGTHLVIADSSLASYQKLCEGLKCRRETSLIPLIIMFPKTVNPDVPEELMICGDEHVVQPFEIKRLLETADAELVRASEEEAIFEQQLVFRFPTTEGAIEKANELGSRLFEVSGLDDEGQIAMAAAFREAIGNAAQHGNRYQKDKKIEALYLQDKEKITVAVTDCGNGFDHEFYVSRARGGDAIGAAKERYRQGRVGGLGIMLMLKCLDKLEYNKKGNRVTLTKVVKRKQVPASAA